jgi:hypothetical protein
MKRDQDGVTAQPAKKPKLDTAALKAKLANSLSKLKRLKQSGKMSADWMPRICA